MQTVIPRPQRTLLSPREIAGYFAEYDISDFSSLTVDSANRIIQWNDKSGNAYNLAQATVANQPIYLPWSGTNYGYLNGVAGNYFSTPDSPAIRITGSLELRWFGAMDDYTPAGTTSLVLKGGAFGLQVALTTGLLRFIWVDSGAAVRILTSSIAPTVTDSALIGFRVSFDPATGTATFFTRSDSDIESASGWTQLGTPQVFGATSIADSAGALEVGSSTSGTLERLSGRTSRALVLNGINGTVVADFNPALYTTGTTFTASTGEVWTLNGGAAIVTQSMAYGDGSNDSLRASFTLAQPYTVIAVMNPRAWTSGRYLWGGNNGANSGALTQTTSTPRVSLNSGSAAAENTNLALQRRAIVQAVFNGASSSLQINGTTATTGNPGTTAPNGLTLFANGAATAASFGAANFNHVLIYSGALDAGSILRLRLWLANKWGVSL